MVKILSYFYSDPALAWGAVLLVLVLAYRSLAPRLSFNLPTAGLDYHVPFGGRKASSYGPREQGWYAREFYTVTKTSYITA